MRCSGPTQLPKTAQLASSVCCLVHDACFGVVWDAIELVAQAQRSALAARAATDLVVYQARGRVGLLESSAQKLQVDGANCLAQIFGSIQDGFVVELEVPQLAEVLLAVGVLEEQMLDLVLQLVTPRDVTSILAIPVVRDVVHDAIDRFLLHPAHVHAHRLHTHARQGCDQALSI
jgi:hypothetical protein